MTTLLTMLTPFIADYGYALIIGVILLESAGLPLPGEAVLVLSAAYAAAGQLSIVGVILAAAGGAILGDAVGYWVGRRGGPNVLRHFSRLGGEVALEKNQAFFTKHGPRAVFFGRFFPLLRVFGAVMAGASEMDYRAFSLWNAAGGLAWAALMGSLGYIFGYNLPLLETVIHRLGIGLVMALAIVAGAIWIGRRVAHDEARTRLAGQRISRWLRFPDLWQWATERWSASGRFGLSLMVGLLVTLLAGWLFGTLAEDVFNRDSVTLYDAGVGRWLLSQATEDSSQFFFGLTLLASTPVLSVLTGLLSVWLGWRRRWLHLGALLAVTVSGAALNLVLKYAFVRPRPDFANAFYHETGFSFPSGHAMLAVVFYGMLAYLLVRTVPRWKWQVTFVLSAATLALLIGFSRLYLGVHYLTDVLGGWAAGSMWLAACITATEAAQYRAHPQGLISLQ